MTKPVVGVIGNARVVNGRFQAQMAGEKYLYAVGDMVGALPMVIPGIASLIDIETLLGLVDGIVLTGSRANVHPRHFDAEPTPAHEPFDEGRDGVALALVGACVDAAIPLFGICRGLQEMNVAYGGTLHPEIRDLPGRMNHRMARLENGDIHPDLNILFADRHDVALTPGGVFERLLGRDTIRVNSLHGQGIIEPGRRIVVEGVAEDGTIEAISVADAPALAIGVQWHAEYDPMTNPINGALFRAFAEAVQAHKDARLSLAGRISVPSPQPATGRPCGRRS